MALKSVRQQVVSSKCEEVDITIPSLSNKEYVALIKEHYTSLASKVIYGRNNKLIGCNDFETLEEYIEASAPYEKLSDFALNIGVFQALEGNLPFSNRDIETCFQNYETDIMPKMMEEQEFYWYNRDVITFSLISEKWNNVQRQKFSEGYLNEFRNFIHKDIEKPEDIYDYGDFQPRGYDVTDNPKGKLVFLISKDGFKQPVYIHCELEPFDKKKFKEVGYYGYDGPFDLYRLNKVAVFGPFKVNWYNKLTLQDKRDIFDFTQNVIKKLGVIRIQSERDSILDDLFPGTKKTIMTLKEYQNKKKNSPSL